MDKIPIYFMPGMAANSLIFEKIKLRSDSFETFMLDWIPPLKKETLKEYAERMTKKVKHENPVLIGVSFGGILVQEMAEIIKVRKVIIISSVKSNLEFPQRIKLARKIKIYKLVPTILIRIEELSKLFFRNKSKNSLKLFRKFLTITDPKYLNWAIEQVVMWDRSVPDEKVIHIQGDRDEIFPTKNIKNYIHVKKGTHIMIVIRYKWFNEHLPEIILKD